MTTITRLTLWTLLALLVLAGCFLAGATLGAGVLLATGSKVLAEVAAWGLFFWLAVDLVPAPPTSRD